MIIAMLVSMEIVVFALLNKAKRVIVPAMDIDMMMVLRRHMCMGMTQGRQHKADAQQKAEHAEYTGHRARV